MIEGYMSVVGIVFLMLVVLPGGVALAVSGRPRSEFSLWGAMFYGLLYFTLALFFCSLPCIRGLNLDRDTNAAINILQLALKQVAV